MDPIALLLAATRAAIAVALLFFVPGLTLGPIFVPGASSRLARLGRAVGVSVVVTAVTCTALARLGLLRPTILVALLVGLTLLPLHSRLPRRPRRPRRRAWRWWFGAVVGAAIALGLAVLPARLRTGGSLLPSGPTAWTDAALAWSTAISGSFVADLPAWGSIARAGVDHGPLTAHSAAAFMLMPSDPQFQLELYRLAVLVAGLVLATMLFRRWVSTWIALLGAVLLFRTVWVERLVSGYGPAAWALVVALFALWLAHRAIVERSARQWLAATATAAVVWMAHVEVFLVLAAAVAGVGIARALVRPGGGPETAGGLGHRYGRKVGLRRPVGMDVFRPLVLSAAIVAVGASIGVVGDAVLTGDTRIGRLLVARPPTEPTAIDVQLAPVGWQPSGDATWDFHVAATDASQFGQPPPAAFIDGRLLPGSVVHVWPWLDARLLLPLLALAALLAVPIGGWPFADARRQRAMLTWAAFAAVLLAGSVALWAFGDTYLVRRTGPGGLVPFLAIVPVVAAVIGLWWLDRWLGPRLRILPHGAMPFTGVVLAAVTALVAFPVSPAATSTPAAPGGPADRPPVLTAAGYEAYRWIGANLLPGSLVLANAWTDGALSAVSGQIGLVDGPALYLSEPGALARATGLLLGARRTFAEPDGPAAATFLGREGVQFLLVVTPAGSGDDLGGHEPFAVDIAALEASARYRLEGSFGDGRLLLFRVLAGPAG